MICFSVDSPESLENTKEKVSFKEDVPLNGSGSGK